MRSLQERIDAQQVIYEATFGDEGDSRSADRALKARAILAEPFNPSDLGEFIADTLSDPDAGGTADYTLSDAIGQRIRGKGDTVIHDTRENGHRLIVNGVPGDWFPVDSPAVNAHYCVMFDRDGEPELFRIFDADLATFIQQD